MEVFLFPLGNVVFYPSTSKPLHIFEPRYVKMVRDALETGTPIAVGFVDEPHKEYSFESGVDLNFVRPVAGFGFPLILEERSDGSLLVFLQGQGKVRLGKVQNRSTPYIVCEAEQLEENHLMKSDLVKAFGTINKCLTRWIEAHIPSVENQQQLLRNIRTPEEVVGCYASYLIRDHDMQQVILESNDINDKVSLVYRLISCQEVV